MAQRRARPPSVLQGSLLQGDLLGGAAPLGSSAAGGPPQAGGLGLQGAGLGQPLADRMRPTVAQHVVGQSHLVGPGAPLAVAIETDRAPSMILWGPPGSGKTTLAQVIATSTSQGFERLSAVLGGIAELRQIVQRAADRRRAGLKTVVFVDEIHRFNRAQQDAFLPHVESGVLTLIGATTENPSFSVNAAILSRCQVFRLKAVNSEALVQILERALEDRQLGVAQLPEQVQPEALEKIAAMSRGDARRALGLLETVAERAVRENLALSAQLVEKCAQQQPLLYDKAGEEHYNVVSALIKSLRGSDPDAAIYWLMRMVDAGDDPLFILRRLLIFASEDVGNADPRALEVAVHADQAFQRMGMPEGLYPMAQACLYLACCPKSNSVGRAYRGAREAIARSGALPVPNKLRNAVTPLMKDHGYADGYQYPHDVEGSYVPGEVYLPESLAGERFYEPSSQGVERRVAEWLAAKRQE